jgi:hypothetical protein
MIPIPQTTVNPKTMAGKLNFIGLPTGAGKSGGITDRLAPQRLQYLRSPEISLPQDGQYIKPPSDRCLSLKDWP